MARLKHTLFLILFGGMTASHGLACSCDGQLDIRSSWNIASSVFIGRTIAMDTILVPHADPYSYVRQPIVRYRLIVDRVFKGDISSSDTIVVFTGVSTADCGVSLRMDRSHIVYGHFDGAVIVRKNDFDSGARSSTEVLYGLRTYWTDRCDRTREYDQAEVRELEALR